MNHPDGGPPPPPHPALPPINHQSTWGILKHAAVIFYAHLSTFLVIAFALCYIRFAIENSYLKISEENHFDFPAKSRNTANSSRITISFPQITVSDDFSDNFSDNFFSITDAISSARILFFTIVTYVYAYFTSIIACICSRGIVFVQVIDHLYGRQRSLGQRIRTGSWIGFLRITYVNDCYMIVRTILVLIISLCCYQFENLLLLLVTNMNHAPWIQGPDWEISDFVMKAFFADMIVGLVFSVAFVVALVDWEMDFIEFRRETFHILVVLLRSAVEIRMMEATLCGPYGRKNLWPMFGYLDSLAIQCAMEVFFLVAWVIYYLSARNLLGRPQLDGFLDLLYPN